MFYMRRFFFGLVYNSAVKITQIHVFYIFSYCMVCASIREENPRAQHKRCSCVICASVREASGSGLMSVHTHSPYNSLLIPPANIPEIFDFQNGLQEEHMSHDMRLPTMWHFDKCRLRRPVQIPSKLRNSK